MSDISAQNLSDMIHAIDRAITAARDELNALDSALGGGDHGTALSVAFSDAVAKVGHLEAPTPAAVLQVTSQSLLNRMGGASGALYGSLFLRAAAAVKDKPALTHDDLKAMWQASLAGVLQRGKAQVGDKTMIDALQPAVQAFSDATSLGDSFAQAARAAGAGAESTSAMIARHGRARFTGERAIGHVDAGARSVAIMFDAMNRFWQEGHPDEA